MHSLRVHAKDSRAFARTKLYFCHKQTILSARDTEPSNPGFMKIPTSLQASVKTVNLDTMSLLKLMKPGQLLQARVLAATDNGLATLLIGRAELSAKTRIPLLQGEPLRLRVEKGLPQPELKIMRSEARQVIEALQRHALTHQLSPKEVHNSLRQLPPSPPDIKPLQQALRVFVPDAPTPRQVNALAVREAMQHSGILFEPTLVQGKVSPKDQKLQLLQLLRLFAPASKGAQATDAKAAQSAPTASPAKSTGTPFMQRLLKQFGHKPGAMTDIQNEASAQKADAKLIAVDQLMSRLQRLVEGSLSRILTHQANTLANEDPGRQVWQFDMPIQLSDKQDHIMLRVQSEEENETSATEPDRNWKVDIDFNFDNLGEISSRINLRGDQVSASFWSQQERTALMLERAIPRLEQALEKIGLEVKVISSLRGDPPKAPAASTGLLDERA